MKKNKTALITGASSGIGKELAIIHAEKGGNLVLVARSIDKLRELKSELRSKYGIKVLYISADLTDKNAVDKVYSSVKKKNIQIDYLINNAGLGGVGEFKDREWEADLNIINLNIIALTELTRKYLPEFANRNSGKILNVSSTASLIPGPLQAVYFASKAYVTSLSNALASELSETNVTVTNLMPGPTETNFGKVSGMDKTDMFKNTSSARDVALAGYRGMINGNLNVIAGVSMRQRIMLKLAPLLPKNIVMKQVKDGQKIKD